MVKFTVHKKKFEYCTITWRGWALLQCEGDFNCSLDWQINGFFFFFVILQKLHSHIAWPERSSNHFTDTAGVAFGPQLKDTRQQWRFCGYSWRWRKTEVIAIRVSKQRNGGCMGALYAKSTLQVFSVTQCPFPILKVQYMKSRLIGS